MPLRRCFVPSCLNTSVNSDKVFLIVPRDEERRMLWLATINKHGFNKTLLYCCEDHFELEKDAENWMYYKMLGRKIILKKDVVPHIFPAKKEESSSQFSAAEKELKRKLLEEYKKGKLKSNVESGQSVHSYYSVVTNLDAKSTENYRFNSQFFGRSSDDEESSNDSTSSNVITPITEQETIVPSRINIQIDPELPEKHQPLLLRKKKKNKKVPEVVGINPPLVEISQEYEEEKSVKNAGSIKNEQLEIKSESELEIKQEEIHIVDVHDNTENYLYLHENRNTSGHIVLDTGIPFNQEMSMDISHQLPDSVQAYLNVEPQAKDLTILGFEPQKTEETSVTVKEEPIDETQDFEFVNVNSRIENSFFLEDPLKSQEEAYT